MASRYLYADALCTLAPHHVLDSSDFRSYRDRFVPAGTASPAGFGLGLFRRRGHFLDPRYSFTIIPITHKISYPKASKLGRVV